MASTASGNMYKRIRSLSDKRRILAEYQDLEHPMLEAVKKGDAVGVQRLAMNLGADAVNEQDAEGWTPLHEASTRGRADIVKVLLNFQANPNVLSQFHRAPLHNAAASGVVAVAELLLEAGASVDPKNNEQWTPLHRACKQQRIDMAVFLVSRGANVSALTDKGETPTDLLVSFANKQRVLAAAGNEDAIRWNEVHSHEDAGAHKIPCPRCGIQMNSKFNFCGMCGARMHGSPTTTPTSPTHRLLRTSHDPTQLAL